MVEKSGVEKFMVEKSGVENSGVGKFMVEKSEVERSGVVVPRTISHTYSFQNKGICRVSEPSLRF